MPRRAKIGEAFSTKVAWLAIVRVTVSNPATNESRRLTKPPRHVGRSPNLPRRVQTGLPLASLEHAGSEKGEQLILRTCTRLFYSTTSAVRQARCWPALTAIIYPVTLRGRSPLAAPVTSAAPGEATKPDPPFMHSFPMPAFPKRGKAVCRKVEGIKSNWIMLCQSNRWNFVGSLLSSLSAVCLLTYAAAVRTLREARPPQEARPRSKTSKQELEAGPRSRRWTWAFCVLSNPLARKFSARPRPLPFP